jgi:YegS/Rv2252/BmrU family lipid kinase
LVLVNPKAGRRLILRLFLPAILDTLRRGGLTCTVRFTRYAGHATALVRRARDQVDCIVVMGGDGTVDEAVRGMDGAMLPLGILPFGTANVLAADLGIPMNPVLAARCIADGALRSMDVGSVNGIPFVLMVSVGLDAFTVHNLNLEAKHYLGKLAYGIAAFSSLLYYRFRRFVVSIGSEGVADQGYLAIVANSRFYGGRFRLGDEISIQDGALDVLLFKKGTVLDTLRLVWGILTQTHRTMPDVRLYRTSRVTIRAKRRIYMQMDGDRVPFTTADIQVAERVLPVFVPAGSRRTVS